MSHESTGTGIDTNTTTSTRETMNINTSLRLTSMLLNINYQSWAKASRISLRGKGKIGYIDGTRQKPTTTLEVEEWEIQDSIILSWLLHSMEPSISEQLVHSVGIRNAQIPLMLKLRKDCRTKILLLLKLGIKVCRIITESYRHLILYKRR
jgi:gag-polypeptide of LTR copia-type